MFYVHFPLTTGCSEHLEKLFLFCPVQSSMPKAVGFFSLSSAELMFFELLLCILSVGSVCSHLGERYKAFNCFWNSTENCLD